MAPSRTERCGASRSDSDSHNGDRVGRRIGGRRVRKVAIRAVQRRLTHREQRLFEEAVTLLLMGSAHRRLTAHKEKCHGS